MSSDEIEAIGRLMVIYPFPIKRPHVYKWKCAKCKEYLPDTIDFFEPSKQRLCGLSSHCRLCAPIVRRERYVKRRDAIKEYYEKHGEYPIPQKRERVEHSVERVRASNNRCRARKANAIGTHTEDDIRLQIKWQTNCNGQILCWWCEKPIEGNYDVDHRIPMSRGGSNNPENIVIACVFCNRSKNDRLPSEWSGRLL